ncbi:unnamed protein product [Polarella glacialis]|uniref:ABC transporter domain-containing protein n=1 Tax=Polarella glacialis TaxID=89957 RepID=A0A813H1Q7_POLGL|nr:unnamed protein product [Polarella glacialis]
MAVDDAETKNGSAWGKATGGALVTFEQVGYSLPVKSEPKGRKHILQDVSGYFEPGTLTAVMGPSGAGKTTFLDIVTGRKTQGEITGSLLFDGKKATKTFLKKHTAYVEQFDTLLGVLTMRDMLLYQAQLKCDRRESLQSKRERVDALIVELGLSTCADVVIGDNLNRGISGGQAKRTNIGIALVTEPRIIFLDEPTSGLDSQTSCDVVSILRRLADSGRTIMSTIHSPTSEAFRMFDRLLLLHKGHTVYFGALHNKNGDASGGAVPYFAQLGLVYDPSTNLADFLITETGDKGEAANLKGLWQDSSYLADAKKHQEQLLLASIQLHANSAEAVTHLEHNMFSAVGVLLRFRSRANCKYPDFIMPRIMPSIFFGFIVGTLYYGAGGKAENPENISARGNVAAALFMSTVMPAFTAAGYMPSIVTERPLFYREHSDGCYTTGSYLLFKVIEEGFFHIFASLIFCLMTFFLIQLPGSFWWHWLLNFVTGQVGIALAYFCGSLAPNMDGANTLLPIINVTSMYFAGVLMTYDAIPDAWKWFPWVTFMRYGWTANMLNNFPAECEMPLLAATPGCPTEYWGLKEGSAGLSVENNFGALCGFWALWLGLTFLVMTFVRHVKR